MTMNRKYIAILAALLPVFAACNPSEGKGGGTAEPEVPSTPVTGDVLTWTTTADQSRLFDAEGYDFEAGNSMSPYVVNIDKSQRYQTVDGFGAAITGATCYNLMQMTQEDRTAFLTRLFGKDNIGSSLIRVSIGASDFPASGAEFTWCDTEGPADDPLQNFAPHKDDVDYLLPILKEIYAINPDVKIIGSPWSAPLWMKDPANDNDGSNLWVNATLKRDCYEVYGEYFAKWIEYMEGQGFDIYAVTPQNEPLNYGNSMSMHMDWEEQRDFIKEGLGPALEAAGLDTKILVFDHNFNYDNAPGQDGYPMRIYEDADASRYVAGSAWHNYGGNVSELDRIVSNYPDKEIYFTEASIGEWNYNFADCLVNDFSTIFIGTLSRMGKGVTLWNLMLDDNKGPFSPADGSCKTCFGAVDISSADYKTLSYRTHYYQIAHASQVIKPGAVRIGTSGFTADDIEYLAFENPDGSIGVIIDNKTSADQNLVFSTGGDYSVRCSVPAKSLVSVLWND